MGNPALFAQDGAEFHGRVQEVETLPGFIQEPSERWRATCLVKQKLPQAEEVQMLESKLFPYETSARAWISSNAAARGFLTWVDDTPQA